MGGNDHLSTPSPDDVKEKRACHPTPRPQPPTLTPSPLNRKKKTRRQRSPAPPSYPPIPHTLPPPFPQPPPTNPPTPPPSTTPHPPHTDILQNQWSPIYDVSAILTSIQSLLCDPNPASPANSEASRLYQVGTDGRARWTEEDVVMYICVYMRIYVCVYVCVCVCTHTANSEASRLY
jgi:hypothetical protein